MNGNNEQTIDKEVARIQGLIDDAISILQAVGIPLDGLGKRRVRRMAEAMLAVGDVKSSFKEALSSADNHFVTTRQIINFENEHLGGNYSSGSYDDVRRNHLILLRTAGFVVSSSSTQSQATNNPTRGYALSPEFASLLHAYGTASWSKKLRVFMKHNEELRELLARKRELEKIPVLLPSGVEIRLSAGEHNALQRDIVQQFLPRFGFGAEVLYIGDAENKFLLREEGKLQKLGFFELEHEELPDIVAYSSERNLLYMIEAVHSYGQMSELRIEKLKSKLTKCSAELVFISAFENKKTFRRFVDDIAWESEVWIADSPDHMIHFNGYKFLEVHKPSV